MHPALIVLISMFCGIVLGFFFAAAFQIERDGDEWVDGYMAGLNATRKAAA